METMNYKEAVDNRYETETFSDKEILDSVYSSINPIGQYGLTNLYRVLSWYIRLLLKESKKELRELQFLDIGCGKGTVTRIIQELCTHGENIYGFDMSSARIRFCRSMNQKIKYSVGDVCNDFGDFDRCFDAITAFDVFMFLKESSDIKVALNNIYKSLNPNGLFLWYDINEDTHFKISTKDSLGFSCSEMDMLAGEVGFSIFESTSLYKNISIFNKSISTYYLANKIGHFWCDILNSLYPGQATINVRVYSKTEQC